MNAVSGGPAYTHVLADTVIEKGIRSGIDAGMAQRLAERILKP